MSENDYIPMSFRMTDVYPEQVARYHSSPFPEPDVKKSWFESARSEFLADLAAHDLEVAKAERYRVIEMLYGLGHWGSEGVPCQCGAVTPLQVDSLTESIKYMEGMPNAPF
jgi:hypothetical protein